MSQHLPPLAEQIQAWRNGAILTVTAVTIVRWARRKLKERKARKFNWQAGDVKWVK